MLKRLIIISLMGAGLIACGSGNNNDQGTSFLAFGFFQFEDGDTSGDPIPIGGVIAELASDTSAVNSQVEIPLIGLENRLETQFIRVARIDCDYDVPGADAGFQVPSAEFAQGVVIGAQPGTEVTDFDGDALLPSADDNVRGQVVFTRVNLVSASTFAFLNANRRSLPQLPFTMVATCRAVGITQAGDVLTTNDLGISVLFEEAADIPVPFTGPGIGVGTGTVEEGEVFSDSEVEEFLTATES